MYLPPLKDKDKKWHVFYARSRNEKKVDIELKHLKVESYLPMITEIKQWSDRKKKVEVPLFKSYIFIKCNMHDLQVLLQWVPGLVSYVRYNGKPAVLREEEIEAINRFVETGLRMQVESLENFKPGQKVKIIGGPLEGLEGEVISENNTDHFLLRIEAIQQVLKVQVPKEYLMKV